MAFGLLLLRAVVGGLFVGHGAQKLFGWFGGGGIDGTSGFFGSLGFARARRFALVAGLTETVGGALIVLGFLTPLGAAMIVGTMTAATVIVNEGKGVWAADGGYELHLVYGVAAAMLAFGGPGPWSVDATLDFGLTGAFYGLAAVSLGMLTGVITASMREVEEETFATRTHRRAA